MNLEDVARTVKQIKQASDTGNNVKAHQLEDALYKNFIKEVARQDTELGRTAELITTVRFLDFERWYE